MRRPGRRLRHELEASRQSTQQCKPLPLIPPILARCFFWSWGSGSSPQRDQAVAQPSASYETVSQSLRTDIVDIALGFKVNLVGSLVGFANVFVPLNDDGLRAKAVPSFGLEYSF